MAVHEAEKSRIFATGEGIVVPAVTESQMREIDRIAIEETGPSLLQMMENAGRNLALQVGEMIAEEPSAVAVAVLAGTGGNGGGGICAARHLANHGVRVLLCLSEPSRLSRVAAWQRQIAHEAGVEEIPPKTLYDREPGLIVDALIGYSLRGAPRGTTSVLIRWANAIECPRLSLDVPSGVDATSGVAAGHVIRADATLTLALPKTGLSPENAGAIVLADIGIPAGTYARLGIDYRSPFGRAYRVPLVVTESARRG